MKFRKVGLVLVGVLLIALYFLNRSDVELNPQLSLQMHSISTSGGEIQAVIRLKNPNLLSSTIKTIHEKFYLNGVLLGIIDNELNQGIPGLKETEFPTSIRFRTSDYQNALALDSTHTGPIILTVNGDIQFQNLFKSGKIMVHQSAPVTNEAPKQ
jgi:LEA14-like dessication related protein